MKRIPRRWMIVAVQVLASAGCGTDEPTGPEFTGDTYRATWGPISVQPGVENTQCVVVDLGNAEPVKIHGIHNTLGFASHHMIVYRDDSATTASPTPTDCTPFAGTLLPDASTSPLMITQKTDDLLELPAGVAYTLGAHQHLRIELHYINATDTPQMVTATSELAVGTPEQIHDEASFLFIGTPDIELQPNQAATVSAFFMPPPSLANVNFYSITGHTHRLGTDMQVDSARHGAAATPVYRPAPFVWNEPPSARIEPAMKLPADTGFQFHCDYFNSTPAVVKFGESANDEMCFFWAYYYPSQGAHMCVHSTLVGGPDGLDVCCPADAGDQLSEFVCSKLAGN